MDFICKFIFFNLLLDFKLISLLILTILILLNLRKDSHDHHNPDKHFNPHGKNHGGLEDEVENSITIFLFYTNLLFLTQI